jgi:hypothetical protein
MRAILPSGRDGSSRRRADRAANCSRHSPRHRPNLWAKLQSPNSALYVMGGMLCAAWMLYVTGLAIAAWLTVAMIPMVLPEASLQLYCKVEVAWNRTGFGRSVSFATACSAVGFAVLTISLVTAQTEVAQAQFFKKAEEYVKTKLAGGVAGADKAIELIFAVLRGLFLIYVGISIVRIVQSARNDQDWQDLARTPMIILIAVILGDVLSTFIIGA